LRIKTTFFLILISALITLIYPQGIKAASITNPSYEVKISATIGEPKLTVFGYSSPNSLVKLEGERVSEQTIAGKDGYFFFDRIFLPNPNPDYPELCLTAIDTQSRISFPTCLPELPLGLYLTEIGPVLLPPTISLEKGVLLPQDQIKAEGLTIPNTEVVIFLANEQVRNNNSLGKIFRFNAFAYSLPQYQIKADEKGQFEFSLPTIKPNNWRLFAAAKFQGSPTPKSNNLNFKVLTWWKWLLLMIANFWGAFLRLIRPFWWLALISLEITITIGLLIKHSHLRKCLSLRGKCPKKERLIPTQG